MSCLRTIPYVVFFSSTKLPILTFSPSSQLFLICAYGPTVVWSPTLESLIVEDNTLTPFPITTFSKNELGLI